MARLVFLSCHLSGSGHLVRTLTLARAAQARGHQATVISGGRALGHLDPGPVELVQLPPLTVSGLDFATLRDGEGNPASEAYMATRRSALGEQIRHFKPDVLVTELFPLGRRMLANEFLGAIGAARAATPRALILSSVRDIPEPKPRRIDEAAERLRQHYDGVLVHGDRDFLPLETTWPLPGDLGPMIHHTGYVGRPVPSGVPRRDDVLVATGGGTLGRRLTELAALAARLASRPWHVLIGGADAAERATALAAAFPAPNLRIEPARPDYLVLLAGAGVSVSLAGYNTAVELAAIATPALLVPSEEGGEKEQFLRARHLAEFSGIELHRLDGLTAECLAESAERLAAGPRRAPIPLTRDDGTAAIMRIENLLAERER